MTAQQDASNLHDLKLRLHYLMRDAHKSDMEDVVILIAAAETAVDEALARKRVINDF